MLLLIGIAATAPVAVRGQAPAAAVDLNEISIDALQEGLRARRVTCRAVVEHYVTRIGAYDQRGPTLNAVVTINPNASAEADRLDAALRTTGPAGPLHCVTVLVKDQLETSDMPTTFGSVVFKSFVPRRDATVVARLRAAGAIVIGKATMGEFALGYAGSISGPIRNPYDPRRHANGSSGGTGAGIAADFATVGIGEDTGGSIRAPASAAALVGLRPTVPLVSRHGVMPSRPSSDTVGPIARTAKDAAIVLDVIAGYDPRDPVTAYAVGRLSTPMAAGLRTDALQGARFALIRQPMSPSTDASSADFAWVRAVLGRAVGSLRAQGAEVLDDVVIPELAGRLKEAGASAVYETESAINAYLAEHPEAPFKTLRDILQTGRVLPWRARTLSDSLGRSIDEPEFGRLQRRAEDTRVQLLKVMADHDLDAFIYASGDHSPGLIAGDVMTNPLEGDTRLGSNRTLASWAGFPAIVVPASFTPDGLPVGLELMGRPFDDGKLLGYAYAFEQATRHRRRPQTTPPLPPR